MLVVIFEHFPHLSTESQNDDYKASVNSLANLVRSGCKDTEVIAMCNGRDNKGRPEGFVMKANKNCKTNPLWFNENLWGGVSCYKINMKETTIEKLIEELNGKENENGTEKITEKRKELLELTSNASSKKPLRGIFPAGVGEKQKHIFNKDWVPGIGSSSDALVEICKEYNDTGMGNNNYWLIIRCNQSEVVKSFIHHIKKVNGGEFPTIDQVVSSEHWEKVHKYSKLNRDRIAQQLNQAFKLGITQRKMYGDFGDSYSCAIPESENWYNVLAKCENIQCPVGENCEEDYIFYSRCYCPILSSGFYVTQKKPTVGFFMWKDANTNELPTIKNPFYGAVPIDLALCETTKKNLNIEMLKEHKIHHGKIIHESGLIYHHEFHPPLYDTPLRAYQLNMNVCGLRNVNINCISLDALVLRVAPVNRRNTPLYVFEASETDKAIPIPVDHPFFKLVHDRYPEIDEPRFQLKELYLQPSHKSHPMNAVQWIDRDVYEKAKSILTTKQLDQLNA